MGRQSWAEPLFPPARRSSLPWPLLVCGYTGGFVLVVVLALARQSGLPATGTLWAEDGVIFYSQAVAHSVLHTLVASYNGYGQLVPRLAVQLTGLGPLRDVPTTVALSGAVGLALVSCLVFHMARGLITSPALRALLVASMVLLPLAVVEMLDNLVNLPWWIFFAAFWALLWRPSGPGGRAVAAVVCLLAAASEPLVGLLMPLALVRAVALPRWRENAASVGLAFGLVYQLAVVLGAHGERSFSRTGVTSIPAALGARVGLGWLTGLRATDAIVRWDRPVAEVVGGVIFLAILVAGLKLGDRRVRALTVTVAVLAPLCFAVPVWLRGAGPYMQTAKSVGYAGRYAATPMLMLISLVLVLAGHLSAGRGHTGPAGQHGRGAHVRGGGRRSNVATISAVALCCVLLVPGWAADFRDRNGRTKGPAWTSRLPAAVAECRSFPRPRLVAVMIDPPVDHVVMTCQALVQKAAEDN